MGSGLNLWASVDRLAHTHRLATFDCGDDWMNDWVRTRALKDDQAGRTAVHVAVNSVGAVVGLYALNHGTIEVAGGRQELRAVQLDRLALHRAHRGKGHGTRLLSDACRAAVAAASIVPAKHFVVEASNDRVASWYESHGFGRVSGESPWLTIPLRSLQATLTALDTGALAVDAFDRRQRSTVQIAGKSFA